MTPFMRRQQLTASLTGLSLFCLLCLFLAGCNQQEQVSVVTPPNPGIGKLTIGLVPEQGIFNQKKRYEPLLAYLSQKLGAPVEIKTLPSYGNVIENFHDLGLDGAFFGSLTGAVAISKLGVEPLARPQYADGSSTYYGMVFVRKDSGIRSAEDMHRKRMVFVDRATTAGYLLPLNYFKTIGINDYKKWFQEYYFSGTHEGAINDVLNGIADIGAAKNTIFYQMSATDDRVLNELKVLSTSPHVPANSLAVRHDLPDEVKRALKQQLLTIHQSKEGRLILNAMDIDKFIETTVDDYQPVFNYADQSGFDLKTYNILYN